MQSEHTNSEADNSIRELAPASSRKRMKTVAAVALALLLAGLLVFCFVLLILRLVRGVSTDLASPDGNEYFNTHYHVDNSSVKTSQHSVRMVLVRDAFPDFSGDPVQPTPDNSESPRLAAMISTETDHRLHVKVVDADQARWEVPGTTQEPLDDPQYSLLTSSRLNIRDTGMSFSEPRFSFTLLDRDSPYPAEIVSTKNAYFRFMEKFVAFELRLNSTRIFGLGQPNVTLGSGEYTLFSRRGERGVNPFIMYQTGELFAGLFLRSSNAMLVRVKIFEATGNSTVRFTTVGGIIDFYVFYKGNAQFILQQYHDLVGKPALSPAWALGCHYAGSNIKSLHDLEQFAHRMSQSGTPVDAVWLQPGALWEKGRTFVLDQTAFAGLREWINATGIHVVSSLDPMLKIDHQYKYYQESAKANSLVRTRSFGLHVGRTKAAGYVAFPNLFHPAMVSLWESGVRALLAETGIDGLWLESFDSECDGDCSNGANLRKPDDPLPFVPGGLRLNAKSLDTSAVYSVGSDPKLDPFLREFNVHSLNPYVLSAATAGALDKTNTRILIGSTDTFPGTQKFAPAYLCQVAPGCVTSFQLLGIPLVGKMLRFDKNEDTRFGLLYPLSVIQGSHNVAKIKEATLAKYALHRFLYSGLFEQSLFGGSAIQPLGFQFPKDSLALAENERVLFYTKGLMILPTSAEHSYFPNKDWYSFPFGNHTVSHKRGQVEGSSVRIENNTVFVMGGTILPYQNASRPSPARRLEDMNGLQMSLIVALDENGKASGTMVADDGVSGDSIDAKRYRHYSFTFSHGVLKVMLVHGYNRNDFATYEYEMMSTVQIWGATQLMNVTKACAITGDMGRRPLQTSFDAERNVLTVADTNPDKLSWREIESIAVFSDSDYDFCAGGFNATGLSLSNEGRTLSASLTPRSDQSGRKYAFSATALSNLTANLKITPLSWQAWEVPGIIGSELRVPQSGTNPLDDFGLQVTSDPFSFAIHDLGSNTVMSTEGTRMALDKRFIELSLVIRAKEIYGLGERVYPHFAIRKGTYTIFSRDAVSPVEDGLPPGDNMYGSHPFYLFRTPENRFGAVLFLSSNAMDISVFPLAQNKTKVTYIATGGVIDLFVIAPGSPKEVLQEYHRLIGLPHLVPYWGFGHQQCRYGYRTQGKLKEVVDRYAAARIPLDVLWTDIDYMDQYTPFTLDTTRYPSMSEFVHWLHRRNIRFVPIVEPAVALFPENEAYRKGAEMHVFIRRGESDSTTARYSHVVGFVWPGYTAFIDFVHPNTTRYWATMLDRLYSLIPFDGIWLDMNEPASFCDGECNLDGPTRKPTEVGNQAFWDLPYVPGHANIQLRALPLDAKHYAASPEEEPLQIQYNLHSMFGHTQIRRTSEYFDKRQRRPFIISRSTFVGSGKYGSHWLGDNWSRWEFLKHSVVGIYNFHMFGIPFVGADVCGFLGDSSIELCRRWYQLAAFYPFCRNHNDVNGRDQEPYVNEALTRTAISALRIRYSLLRYMYTLHMLVSMRGGAYFMPMMYEFPDDPRAYERPEDSFMLGPSIKVTPVLTPVTRVVSTYFPNANWYDFYTGQRVLAHKHGENVTGTQLSLDAPLDSNYINVHIRGGSIFPLQDTTSRQAMNTEELRRIETGLVVAPDHEGRASGLVFFDDGESPDAIQSKAYLLMNMTYTEGELRLSPADNATYSSSAGDEFLGEVRVLSAEKYENTTFATARLTDGNNVSVPARYDQRFATLHLLPNGTLPIVRLRSVEWERSS